MAGVYAGTSDSCETDTKIVVSDELSHEKCKNSGSSLAIIPIMDRAINNFESKIRYRMFVKYFPELHKKDPAELKAAHKNFLAKLTTRIRAGVRDLTEECMISTLLTEMNEMSASQPTTDKNGPIKGWRPSGNPHKDISAHLVAAKLEIVDRVKKNLVDTKKRRDELASGNIEACAKLMQLQQKLDEHLKKIEAAATAIQQIPNGDIDKFTSCYESDNNSRNMKRQKTKGENA